MNTKSTAKLFLRSIVRFAFAFLVMGVLVFGIPIAVELVWPALIASALLWVLVIYYHRRDQKMRYQGN